MRRGIAWLFVVGSCLVACTDDEPNSPAASTPALDAGSTPPPGPGNDPDSGSTAAPDSGNPGTPSDAAIPNCPGAKSEPDSATVAALFSMFGSWQFEKERLNGNEGDLSPCVKANGMHIGPEVPTDATYDYARCAVATGKAVPVKNGEYPAGQVCAPPGTGCTTGGLRMISAVSGGIFAVTASGFTTGNASTFLLPIPGPTSGTVEIIQSSGGTTQSGYRMVSRAMMPSCP